ncbi:MAG TPA: cysteine hydrolase [Solirubrobacterales bacterium]|nr:cysteine hydrolase [Solirubrobacterales bacterium]
MSDTSNETAKLDPKRTALLVMDYQPAILERVDDPDALTAGASAAIDTLREAGATIGYVRVGFTDEDMEAMPEGAPMGRVRQMPRDFIHAEAPGTQVDERVAPGDGDIVVRKVRVGSFGTTDLDEQLRARGVDTLVLAGISTSGVLLSTVRDAHDRDYSLYVLADASADPDAEVHEFLVEKIFPRQAEVIDVADLAGLLG